MSRQRAMDVSLLILAGGFLVDMVILIPLAVFADPVAAFGVGSTLWIGYAVIAYRAVTADQPADPNPPLPWEGLDALFDDWWGDAKGRNMTVAALNIGTVLLFVTLLILVL